MLFVYPAVLCRTLHSYPAFPLSDRRLSNILLLLSALLYCLSSLDSLCYNFPIPILPVYPTVLYHTLPSYPAFPLSDCKSPLLAAWL
jgi:hypothetical protein